MRPSPTLIMPRLVASYTHHTPNINLGLGLGLTSRSVAIAAIPTDHMMDGGNSKEDEKGWWSVHGSQVQGIKVN